MRVCAWFTVPFPLDKIQLQQVSKGCAIFCAPKGAFMTIERVDQHVRQDLCRAS